MKVTKKTLGSFWACKNYCSPSTLPTMFFVYLIFNILHAQAFACLSLLLSAASAAPQLLHHGVAHHAALGAGQVDGLLSFTLINFIVI